MMEGDEFAALKKSIADNNKRVVVTLFEGKILDGRNRWRACRELGIKAKTVVYDGDDPLGFVLQENLHRRHLDPSQKGMIGARVARLKWGGDRKSTNQGENFPLDLSIDDAAKQLNISGKTVKHARKVLESGAPELVQAVERSRIAVSIASTLVKLP